MWRPKVGFRDLPMLGLLAKGIVRVGEASLVVVACLAQLGIRGVWEPLWGS